VQIQIQIETSVAIPLLLINSGECCKYSTPQCPNLCPRRSCEDDDLFYQDCCNDVKKIYFTAATTNSKQNDVSYCKGPVRDELDREEKDFLMDKDVQVIKLPGKNQIRWCKDDSGAYTFDMRENNDVPFVLRPGFGRVPEYLEKVKSEILQEKVEREREMENRASRSSLTKLDPDEREALIYVRKSQDQIDRL
jgi:hypothetical protein